MGPDFVQARDCHPAFSDIGNQRIEIESDTNTCDYLSPKCRGYSSFCPTRCRAKKRWCS